VCLSDHPQDPTSVVMNDELNEKNVLLFVSRNCLFDKRFTDCKKFSSRDIGDRRVLEYNNNYESNILHRSNYCDFKMTRILIKYAWK
jgi:hypothetical protein